MNAQLNERCVAKMKHNLKYFFWKVWFSGIGSRMFVFFLLLTTFEHYYKGSDSDIFLFSATIILLFILIKTAIWYLRGAKIDKEN